MIKRFSWKQQRSAGDAKEYIDMKRILGVLLMLAVLMNACAALAAEESSFAVITKGVNVNLRKQPGGEIITKVPRGTTVYVVDSQTKNGKLWRQIIVSLENDHYNCMGWMDASYLTGVYDLYENVAEAAVGDRHVLLRMEDGTAHAFGFAFRDNLAVDTWDKVGGIAAGRFTSFGFSEDGMTVYANSQKSQSATVPLVAIYANSHDDETGALTAQGQLLYDCYSYSDGGWNSRTRKYVKPDQKVTDAALRVEFRAYITEDSVLHTKATYDITQGVDEGNGLQNAVKVEDGGYDLYVLMADGSVQCFGMTAESLREQIAEWHNVVDIAAGNGFVAALMDDGTVRFAGTMPAFNMDYRDANRLRRTNLEDAGYLSDWQDIVSIAAGDNILVGVTEDGRIRLVAQYVYE